MVTTRRRLIQLASAVALMSNAGWAVADSYPSKPIRILCAFAPGQSADIAARALADGLAPRLGQPLIVDNRPGASGTIATRALTNSAPDGYTLLMTSTSLAINTAILANLPYDLEKDFLPIRLVNAIPAVLIVNKSFPANTFPQLMSELKRHPGKYTFGHPGVGTMQNLVAQVFMQETGTSMVEVPYKGSSQAITEIMNGSLTMMFEAANNAAGQIKGDRVKGIVASGPTRYFALPQIPAAREFGIGLSVVGFTVLVAPAGTPRNIAIRLHHEIGVALETPQVRERMANLGMDIYRPLSIEETAKELLAQSAQYIATAKAAKIQKQ